MHVCMAIKQKFLLPSLIAQMDISHLNIKSPLVQSKKTSPGPSQLQSNQQKKDTSSGGGSLLGQISPPPTLGHSPPQVRVPQLKTTNRNNNLFLNTSETSKGKGTPETNHSPPQKRLGNKQVLTNKKTTAQFARQSVKSGQNLVKESEVDELTKVMGEISETVRLELFMETNNNGNVPFKQANIDTLAKLLPSFPGNVSSSHQDSPRNLENTTIKKGTQFSLENLDDDEDGTLGMPKTIKSRVINFDEQHHHEHVEGERIPSHLLLRHATDFSDGLLKANGNNNIQDAHNTKNDHYLMIDLDHGSHASSSAMSQNEGKKGGKKRHHHNHDNEDELILRDSEKSSSDDNILLTIPIPENHRKQTPSQQQMMRNSQSSKLAGVKRLGQHGGMAGNMSEAQMAAAGISNKMLESIDSSAQGLKNSFMPVTIKEPQNAQQILDSFRDNLYDRQRQLLKTSYQQFGNINSSELIKRFVPRDATNVIKLGLAKVGEGQKSKAINLKKLNPEELDRVIKDSYKTLITIKNPDQKQPTTQRKNSLRKDPLNYLNASMDSNGDTKENLKAKYARFTRIIPLQYMGNHHHHHYPTSDSSNINSLQNSMCEGGPPTTDAFGKKHSVQEATKSGFGNVFIAPYGSQKGDKLRILECVQNAQSPQQHQIKDLFSHQVLMKKIDEHLKTSPKRLNSILENNLDIMAPQINFLSSPQQTENPRKFTEQPVKRSGLLKSSGELELVRTSVQEMHPHATQHFSNIGEGFFTNRMRKSVKGSVIGETHRKSMSLFNSGDNRQIKTAIQEKIAKKGLGGFMSAAISQRPRILHLESSKSRQDTQSPEQRKSIPKYQDFKQGMVFSEVYSSKPILQETFDIIGTNTTNDFQNKIKIIEGANSASQSFANFFNTHHYSPTGTLSERTNSPQPAIADTQIIQSQQVTMRTSSIKKRVIEKYDFKQSKDQSFLGFRIPCLNESLYSTMTNNGPFQLVNKAVWQRIRGDEARDAKQTVKIEDKLATIQRNASLMNVEKRKELMSDADKSYNTFIVETVDSISRMRQSGPFFNRVSPTKPKVFPAQFVKSSGSGSPMKLNIQSFKDVSLKNEGIGLSVRELGLSSENGSSTVGSAKMLRASASPKNDSTANPLQALLAQRNAPKIKVKPTTSTDEVPQDQALAHQMKKRQLTKKKEDISASPKAKGSKSPKRNLSPKNKKAKKGPIQILNFSSASAKSGGEMSPKGEDTIINEEPEKIEQFD
ncbi:hypothetical protein FGO68_gene207 [Halteria grandinella]|uniref:Uncharacterized protein n=1 Tax=Halteria grandinella TaxID=5974 RepID=A0A8J8P4D0_HALGN|nr:hypothetical protein FGO68_gene207 [Halteria grandinella]